MRQRNTAIAGFLLLALTGLALLSIYLLMPPSPVPATAPATTFSAERAMQHVHQIAKEPHAMGTAAHAQVREYLLKQLQQLGLNPQVQQSIASDENGAVTTIGNVYNILGRFKGTGSGRQAILLMAHYDSQPNARGAGDDGAGVAAILETVRALKQEKPLEHDVIVLLTDGEEYGLFGAKAFMEHPWAKEVAIVLNAEARGNEGPSMTFEMSPQNGWVAKQFIKAAPYPFVSSLAYEIYSRMPNDTDFTIFKDAGYSGLNSAFIDGFVHYHKITDNPENLNQGSVQHHGSNMLALVRHFGSIDLTETKAPDTVFFNLINGWVINYPVGLNILWIALAALLLLVTVTVAIRKQEVTGWQVIAGVGLYLLLLVVVVGVFIPVNKLVLQLMPLTHGHNGVYSSNAFLIAYLLLALGLFILLSWFVLRWLSLLSLMLGVFILQFILMIGLYLLVPAAAYLLLFPLLFSMGGTLLALMQELYHKPEVCWRYALILLVAAIPAIFIITPIVHVVFVAFALQLPVGAIALFVLILGLVLPLLVILERSFSWRSVPLLPLALLAAGIIQVAQAIDAEKPSEKQPLHSHVAYYLNSDDQSAYWVSNFAKTDEWNRQFFTAPQIGPLTEIYPDAQRINIKNQAVPVALPVPVAEVLSDSVGGAERLLRLRLSSPRGAAHLEFILQPATPDTLQAVAFNGRELYLHPIPTETTPVYHFRYYGLPLTKDAVLEVRLKKGVPLNLLLYDHTLSLPQELVKQPKPAHVVPEQGRDSNITVVRKTYTF
ncbi:M20/M25/M40 family metallo-hydrolase [Pontibacter sp. KCTC 32443]|uniref:M20/M25/M40 family metallo-hydrolase n=1 Tax=Pontibacter TaxID=323449 RepID=UPI00164D73C1|nr:MULTISPECIES: M20/M25/M40 family metallo-hydrolase [Pontibacter]MBC5774252.1 M20/M25/M40 family metallo-hydrolase [Pontibacter sp. KCTC 32443]